MAQETEKTSRLGVNCDHVATLREVRGTPYPDPVDFARMIADLPLHNITMHLREDQRHVKEEDLRSYMSSTGLPPLNLEVGGMELKNAEKYHPKYVCIVPERREEKTTEKGISTRETWLGERIERLKGLDMHVHLFIDVERESIDFAKAVGASGVEFHTGPYTLMPEAERSEERRRMDTLIARARAHGLEVHAGHGLTYKTAEELAKLPFSVFNIGHFLICAALFMGARAAVEKMLRVLSP